MLRDVGSCCTRPIVPLAMFCVRLPMFVVFCVVRPSRLVIASPTVVHRRCRPPSTSELVIAPVVVS